MVAAVVLENVTKTFTLRYHRTFKEVTVAKVRGHQTSEKFNAIDDVTFTIEEGEAVGLIGLNGSGKSTLLKMINGVMRPDKGTLLTRGRIAGLIATGAGFHQQLSGRDNLVLNAAILGMGEREIQRKMDSIIEFADLGKVLDAPVGFYSSGQRARLGFAVAIHVDSDIFLADEVLAVGDKPFKAKCVQKMEEVRSSGRTLIFVSHSGSAVQRMCNRGIVLEQGRVGFDGTADDAVSYLKYGDDDPVGEDEASIGADI